MSDILELLLLMAIVLAVLGTAAWAGIRAAPWVPTRSADVRRLLRLARVRPGELVVDLGCGDGRVLCMAAEEFGARAVGYELSLLPYLVAKLRAFFHRKRDRIDIRFRDFYGIALNEADVVFCFLSDHAMKRLRTKFVQELKPGARVVSYAFSLSDLPGVVRDKPTPKLVAAYLYRQPDRTARLDAA